jgi:uncharacterized protein YdeI (BOF family)
MKRIALSLIFAALVVPAMAGATIKFEKTTHEFGDVEKGAKVSYTFKFTNSGDTELDISDVKPSCGCTTAEMSKTKFAPGESGEIPVTFDTSRFNGPMTKTVNVSSNDEANPKVTLKLVGNISQEINVNPGYVTLVNISRTEKIEREVKISTARLEKLEVTDVTCTLDFVKVEVVRQDDKNVILKASFNAADVPLDRASNSGFINFKTNGKTQPDMKVNFFVKVANPITLSPRAAYFFGTAKGNSREQILNIKADKDAKFQITDINSDLEYVSAEPMGDEKFKVTLKEDAPVGKFSGVITVKTDLKEQPVVKIPVRGNIIEQAAPAADK